MLQAHMLCKCIGTCEGLVALCAGEQTFRRFGTKNMVNGGRTWTWAGEGLLSCVRPYVRDEGEPRGLSDATADAACPFASVVRLVYTDVIYEIALALRAGSIHGRA